MSLTQPIQTAEPIGFAGPMFDYATAAKELHVPSHIVRELESQVRAEFPNDSMLMELHMLRAVKAKAAQYQEEHR
jgi:hypothetical protein